MAKQLTDYKQLDELENLSSSMGRSVDLGGADVKEPEIEISLGF